MDLRYHVHAEYIEVAASGVFDMAEGKACIDEIHRLCEKHHLAKILVDVRGVPEQLSMGSRFNLADYLISSSPRPIRVSVLATSEHINHTRTFENTANNRGGQTRSADTLSAALAFLGLGSPEKL